MSDRAVAYGDGCFTTIAKVSGTIQLLNDHIARMQKSCSTLGITFSAWGTLKQQILDVSNNELDTVIKVIITRGSGGRGYSTDGANSPSSIISLHQFPEHYSQWRSEGISLALSDIKISQHR